MGYREDNSKLTEKRYPPRGGDLDRTIKDNPVLLSTVGGHFSISNRLAFELVKVSKDSLNPVSGRFDWNLETEDVTGNGGLRGTS